GSKLQNCGDIVRFEIGIVRKDLLTHGTGGEEFEHILYTNTKTTNGRTAAANVCGHGDSIQPHDRATLAPPLLSKASSRPSSTSPACASPRASSTPTSCRTLRAR